MALISVFIKKSGGGSEPALSFDLEDSQITSFGIFAINAIASDTMLGYGTKIFPLGATMQSNVYTLDGETIGVATFGVGAQAQYA